MADLSMRICKNCCVFTVIYVCTLKLRREVFKWTIGLPNLQPQESCALMNDVINSRKRLKRERDQFLFRLCIFWSVRKTAKDRFFSSFRLRTRARRFPVAPTTDRQVLAELAVGLTPDLFVLKNGKCRPRYALSTGEYSPCSNRTRTSCTMQAQKI